MMTVWIWVTAAAVYGLFLRWYFNWSRPMTAVEVEQYIQRFAAGEGVVNTDPEVLRRFLEQDDGGEFVMQNLIKLQPGAVTHPITGQPVQSRLLLEEYTKPFIKALFRRGGHPVLMARKVGGYIDSWNCDADPEWSATAMMRYRSRRDLIELASDNRFADMHIFKLAAIDQTVSFPTQISLSLFLRPAFYVPMIILFVAVVMQLAVLLLT